MAHRIHHLGIAAGRVPLHGAIDLETCARLDLGGAQAGSLVRGPNFYLECWEPGTHPGPRPRPVNAPGLAHLCLQSRDGERTRSALEAGGTRFLSEPVALGTGYLYAYAHDADGRLLELESASFLPVRPPSWFGHVAFVSPRADRLAAFYGALLDASVSPGGRFSDNARIDQVAALRGVDVEVWWVQARPLTLEFWRYIAPPPTEPDDGARWYTHLGIEVDDLGAALERIAILNGAVTGEASDGADGRVAWARDPDGNRLKLIELSPSGADRGVAALPHADVLVRAAAARGGG